MIDQITEALGDQKAFAAAAGVIVVALIGGLVAGKLAAVASIATLATFVMVFAVQHTSSRESRALNVKLDELIRVTSARNELIGAEDESHAQLDERREQLLGASGRARCGWSGSARDHRAARLEAGVVRERASA